MATMNALDMIAKHESAWRNVRTGAQSADGFNLSTGTYTAPSTASGYWQITNTTWRSYAPGAGVDTSLYPTAMSAPYETQRQVAGEIYDKRGFADWAPYNSNIRNDLSRYGQGSYGSDSEVSPNPPGGLTTSGYDKGDDYSKGVYSNGQDPNNLGDTSPGSYDSRDPDLPRDTGEGPLVVDVKKRPDGSTENSSEDTGDYIDGKYVSNPKAGKQGTPKDVPTAIVTAADQQAKATAAAAKSTSEAELKAAQTTTKSDQTLQSQSQSYASNWAVRIFLFIIGAIFIGGGLLLFTGQQVFNEKSPA